MKKRMKTLALATAMMTAASSLSPSSAQAMIGIATGNVILMVSGLVATTAGLGVFFSSSRLHKQGDKFKLGVGGMGMLIGAILLDGEEGQELVFKAVGEEAAAQLGLSEGERASFNDEIEELNQVSSAVRAELGAIQNPTEQDSKALWERYGKELAPETYSAAQKVAAQLARSQQ